MKVTKAQKQKNKKNRVLIPMNTGTRIHKSAKDYKRIKRWQEVIVMTKEIIQNNKNNLIIQHNERIKKYSKEEQKDALKRLKGSLVIRTGCKV